MDLDVPDALPTMVCRPPTLNGTPQGGPQPRPRSQAMPGVTDVALVADRRRRARARRSASASTRSARSTSTGTPGTVDGRVRRRRARRAAQGAELPLAVPKLAAAGQDGRARLHVLRSAATPRSRPTAAIADVRADRPRSGPACKSPIVAAGATSPTRSACRSSRSPCNVITGGGSFGRQLFSDARVRGRRSLQGDGQAGQADVAPHRRLPPGPGAPDVHVAGPGDLRSPARCSAFEQRHTSVATDFRHGLGELLTAMAAELPAGLGNLGLRRRRSSRSPRSVPYNFGAVTQLLNEVDAGLQHRQHAQHLLARRARAPASSWSTSSPRRWARTRYAVPARVPQATTASRAVLDKVAEAGELGPVDAGRHGPGHRDPQGVQGRDAPASSRSTAGPATVNRQSATASPARASPRPSSPSTSACRSTRAASRPR